MPFKCLNDGCDGILVFRIDWKNGDVPLYCPKCNAYFEASTKNILEMKRV